jgi:hypothetical protein
MMQGAEIGQSVFSSLCVICGRALGDAIEGSLFVSSSVASCLSMMRSRHRHPSAPNLEESVSDSQYYWSQHYPRGTEEYDTSE